MGSRIACSVSPELDKEIKQFHAERAKNLDNASFGSTIQILLSAGIREIQREKGQAAYSPTKVKIPSDRRTKSYRQAIQKAGRLRSS